MINNIAPIGISTYKRLEHLKLVINALKRNVLAEECDLYIFSDAAKRGDEEKVNNLRNYLKSVNGVYCKIEIRKVAK